MLETTELALLGDLVNHSGWKVFLKVVKLTEEALVDQLCDGKLDESRILPLLRAVRKLQNDLMKSESLGNLYKIGDSTEI